MKKLDASEKEILDAYEKGELKSTPPSKAKLAKFKAAALVASPSSLTLRSGGARPKRRAVS